MWAKSLLTDARRKIPRHELERCRERVNKEAKADGYERLPFVDLKYLQRRHPYNVSNSVYKEMQMEGMCPPHANVKLLLFRCVYRELLSLRWDDVVDVIRQVCCRR